MKTKSIAVLIGVCFIILLAGCGNNEGHSDSYIAKGEIGSVEKSGAKVDGVKSEYVVKLVNLQPDSNPSPEDVQDSSYSITPDTSIYRYDNGEKTKADISAVEEGKQAEIVWHFANDHLIEAVEISMK